MFFHDKYQVPNFQNIWLSNAAVTMPYNLMKGFSFFILETLIAGADLGCFINEAFKNLKYFRYR